MPLTNMPSIVVDEELFLKAYSRSSVEEQKRRIQNAIEQYLPCQNVSAKRTLTEMIDRLIELVREEEEFKAELTRNGL